MRGAWRTPFLRLVLPDRLSGWADAFGGRVVASAGLGAAISTDAEAVLFSIKTFAAAMLSYYIALRSSLQQPVWAVTTVYLVAQPLAGAVISKALFRLLGTILGGAAAVVFVPSFVNEPIALSLVLSLWLGLCVYVSQLDRTPRSYAFLLSGYTTSVIGFPSVTNPGGIFNTAVYRIEEIGVAIVMVSVVHGAFLPRTVTKRLQQQLSATFAATTRLSRRTLAGSLDPDLDRDRRLLATSVNDIELLSYQSAFDTARLIPPAAAIRAFQDQVSWLMPLDGTIGDRIAELGVGSGTEPPGLADFLARIDEWLAGPVSGPRRGEMADGLVRTAASLRGPLEMQASWCWRDMLFMNLLLRLEDLVAAHLTLHGLLDQLAAPDGHAPSARTSAAIRSAAGRWYHRDHGLALRSSLGATVAVFGVCVFWIATAWPNGAVAAVIAGISCALFGTLPQPGLSIRRFFLGSVLGIFVAAFLGFVLLPRATDFVTLVALLAPFLILIGSMQTRRPVALIALGIVVGLFNTGIFVEGYEGDFAVFTNGAVAQVAATLWSVVVIDVFHVVGTETAFDRLLRAGFRDIALRAEGRARDTRRWTSRMVDRVALIAARSAQAGPGAPSPAYDALVGLRIGFLAGELRALLSSPGLGIGWNAAGGVVDGISKHFRSIRPRRRESPGQALLLAIDGAIAAITAEPPGDSRSAAVVTLTGLRRILYPGAAAYVDANHVG